MSKSGKLKPAQATPKPDVVLTKGPGESEATVISKHVMRPSFQGSVTATALLKTQFPGTELGALAMELQEQAKLTSGGDLSRLEAMLTVQAHTLDLVFNRLIRVAMANVDAGYGEAADRYLRLALRAQTQVRVTAETLSEMKHPKPVAFVQQANIAHGPQQVNNGGQGAGFQTGTRTGEIENRPNELLETNCGERLDNGTARPATAGNQDVAAVDAIHRATDAAGKS